MYALAQVESTFVRWGFPHLTALFLGLVAIFLWIWVARNPRYTKWDLWIRWGVASLLLMSLPAKLIFNQLSGNTLHIGYVLPMHLCDWCLVIASVALFKKHHPSAELTYFWALAGTSQGLITPDLPLGFPSPVFFVFFLQHVGLVVVALYLPFGLGLKPRKWAPLRVFLWMQVYAVSAGVVNYLAGSRPSHEVNPANYGFICHKPLSGSLLDAFGNWPNYLIGIQISAFVFFLLLYLPFYKRN